MRVREARRLAIAAVTAFLFVVFSAAALTGTISSGQALLALSAALFVYIAVRLSHELFDASPEHRRKARRQLILFAAVPGLILTPAVTESAPVEYAPIILLSSVIWVALAMSLTSFVLGRAADATGASSEPHAHRRRRPAHNQEHHRIA
jgi:hypothetical protein